MSCSANESVAVVAPTVAGAGRVTVLATATIIQRMVSVLERHSLIRVECVDWVRPRFCSQKAVGVVSDS